MSAAPHSPAPWSVDPADRSPARLLDSKGECLAHVYLTEERTRRRTPAHVANAHVIAAAPALLEACRRALFILESPAFPASLTNGGGALDVIRAAIAKAEGAEQT